MQITRGIVNKPLRTVVYGPEGIGKSTFASMFPNPVFIDTENSTDFLDVARFPKPSSWTMLLQEIKEAKALVGQFQTLVVDTGDWAERLCKEHVIATQKWDSIEQPNYGKGYVYLSEEWGKFLNALTDVRDAGMNVVLTAHAQMRKFEQPDELGSYDRWELKLERRDAQMVKEWADAVFFANYETFVVKQKKGDTKGKAQGGKRVMYTSHHPCWDAKNRMGLPEKLPFNFAEIAQYIPGTGAEAPAANKTETEIPALETNTSDTENPILDADCVEKTQAQTDSNSEAEITASASGTPPDPEVWSEPEEPNEDLPFDTADSDVRTQSAAREPPGSDVPKALADLMREAQVLEDEVRDVISTKGYYPKDTPWDVMTEEGFVDGWIIPFWDKIVEMIQANPKYLPF